MRNFILFAAIFGQALFGAALAQPGPPQNEGWQFGIGGGPRFAPTYVGDDDYQLSILPSIEIKYGDRFFASVQNGVGYKVINENGFEVGPIARVRFARNEDGDQAFAIAGDDTTDLIGLGDVPTTAELGGFVNYKVQDFTFGVEARRGVNGHEGLVVDADAKYSGRSFVLGPPIIFSVGPRVTIVDDNYHSAYFGVDAGQSLLSGLPVFDAGGGIHSYGVGVTFILPITRDNSMSAVLVAGYDRLAGDAGSSPLVQLRGSRDQASIGLFFSYWFR